MPVKVLDRDGFGSNSGIAEGIDYAVNFRQGGVNPVRVINLSLGGPTRSQVLQTAIDRAVAAGITVVASAGNDNTSPVDFPAGFSNVIAVGSVDGRKVKAPYSSYGADLDLMAPGGDLRRDDNGDGRPDGVLQQTFDPAPRRRAATTTSPTTSWSAPRRPRPRSRPSPPSSRGRGSRTRGPSRRRWSRPPKTSGQPAVTINSAGD